jgi:N-acetylneuraminic acid mutarotase
VIGTKIYVVSGETNSAIVNNNEIYNTVTNTWTTGSPIPTPRYAGASAVVNGILYVMGGIVDATQTPIDVVEAYNPTTNTWSTKAPMPITDDSVNAVVQNGLIYVIGGYTAGARSAIVQRYNPATNSWASEAPLLLAKSDSVLGVLGTTIVSAGGLPNTNTPSGDNEGYNSGTNTWSTLTADATPRNGACGASVAGQLYLTGGSTSGLLGSATTATESYNLTKNAWTTLLPVPLAVIGGLPAVSGNQLYCFGGTDNGALFQGNIYNNVQIYQP